MFGKYVAARLFTTVALTMLSGEMLVAQTSRIAGPIDDTRTVTIPGHINPRAQAGTDRGPVEGTFPLDDLLVTLKPSPAQQAALAAFLAAQQDAASPDFHNWLTPAQFADRFGAAPTDLDRINRWLSAEGFTVHSVAGSRNWIAFGGTAAVAESAFGVEIHRYLAEGQSHFATATEPRVPAAIASLVAGLRGFDDFLPRPLHSLIHTAYTSGSTYHYLAPGDAATIYNFNSLYQNGYDGTGQTLAVVGQSAINLSDIDNFRSIFNFSKNDPQLVTVPNMPVPGIVSNDEFESDLDLEWAGAVAKNAKLIFVYTTNVFTALQYAVTQNLAPVISISYGACETEATAEASVFRGIAQQANAQGITLVSASGDQGPFACDNTSATAATHGAAVALPASIPEVTGVGGTEFNEGGGTYWSTANNANGGSAVSYIPEAGWNETSSANGLAASGGGPSALFAKPSWQTGPGVPADGARDVPDVAMAAAANHDGAIICTSGGCASGLSGATVVGGTSVAAPLFAGIATLVNHYQVASGSLSKAGLGNVNPTLYALAQNYAEAFHDVTTGNNVVPCRASSASCASGSFGYQAGPGYDLVTGLGSVNAYALALNWSLIKAAPAVLSSVSASPSTVSGGATVTVTAALTAAAPSGGVKVTLSGSTAAFSLPTSIVVPSGQLSASVNVAPAVVTVSTSIVVTAAYNGVVKTTTVTIVPAILPSLSSVTVSQASIIGGARSTLTIGLSAPAPIGGATVDLSSNNSAFPVPANVVVPAGAKTANVAVQTFTVTTHTSVTITATYNGGTKTTGITVMPDVLPSLSLVLIAPTNLAGGTTAVLAILLSGSAPPGGASVALQSNSAAFPVPTGATIPAGAAIAVLLVETSVVKTSTSVTVTATYNGGSQTATATLTPVAIPTLIAVSVSPSSLKGGSSATLTITLSAPASASGTTIALTSSNAAFPVPASVVMPAGSASGSLRVQTKTVSATSTVTITAKSGGTTQTTGLSITP
jgi:hypothetical protein